MIQEIRALIHIAIALLGMTLNVHSQIQPMAINYGVGEGLPSSESYCVIQDAHRFIWVGTDRGVCRFDGTHFQLFSKTDGLESNVVFHIDEGKPGQIWFLSMNNRLSVYEDGQINSYRYNSILDSIIPNQNNLPTFFSVNEYEEVTLGYDGKPVIEIDQNGGLNTLELDKTDVSVFVKGDNIFAITIKQGTQIGTDFPDFQMVQNGRKTIVEYFEPLHQSIHSYRQNKLQACQTMTGDIYFSFSKRVFRIEKGSEQLTLFAEMDGNVLNMVVKENQLYVGCIYNGLTVFNLESGQRILRAEPSSSITGILFDDNENLWLSSLEKGVYLIPDLEKRILRPDESFSKIALDEKYLYAESTSGGLRIFDHQKVESSLSLSDYPLTTLKKVPGRNLVVAKSSAQDLRIYHEGKIRNSVKTNTIRDICLIDSGFLAITYNSVFFLDSALTEYSEFAQTSTGSMNAIYSTLGDSILIATNQGLLKLDSQERTLHPLSQLEGIRCTDLKQNKDGVIAIPTRGDGLYLFHENKTLHLTSKNGLISDDLDKVLFSGKKIVVSAKKGVSIIDYSLKEQILSLQNLQAKKVFQSNEINDFDISDSELWVAGSNGIAFVPLNNEKNRASKNSSIILKDVLIDGRPQEIRDVYPLHSSASGLEVQFVAISYEQQGQLHYRYKLEGFEKNWNYTNENQIAYKALPFGEYKLLINYQEWNGQWSSNKLTLLFSKPIPFWKTSWFFVLCALALFGFVLILIRRRGIKQSKRKDNLLLIKDLERKAYQSQMNPHFIFNSLNTIQSFISQGENKKAEKYLSKFSRLVRTSLHHSALEKVELEEELKLIGQYVEIEQMRFPQKFDYRLERGNSIGTYLIPPMLIQPFVENAIIHGLLKTDKNGILTIKIDPVDSKHLRIIIEDNGPGLDKESIRKKLHSSKGISITKDRLSLLDSDCKVEVRNVDPSKGKSGTVVKLIIPIYDQDSNH